MNVNDSAEILLQHGNDTVLLRCIPASGVIALRKIALDGTTIANSRAIIEIADHPDLECLLFGKAWYLPLLAKVLRLYDDQLEETTLPYFVAHHYNKIGQTSV